jgi:hypothetical protein
MWKSHFNVDAERNRIHSPCGNRCGNLQQTVEISGADKVFHISTGIIFTILWKCGKLKLKLRDTKSLTENRTVEKTSLQISLITCKDYP